jgi:peptidoglycan-N-acetylglucosamine deacetylase
MSDSTAAATGWRGGSAAVAVLSFGLDAETPILCAGRRYADHAMVMSHQAFEPRVAVPRLLGLLAEYDIKATFFVPGFVAERWPAMVTSVVEHGHEVAHHSYSHRPSTSLNAEEEAEEFERGLAALDNLDIHPVGYRAPSWAATWRTRSLVAQYGMMYDSSMMDDDKPYVTMTDKGPIVELPPHWSLDDWEQYAYLIEPNIGQHVEAPEKVLSMWKAELDGLRRYRGLYLLTNHAFLSGRAGRAEGLRSLIEYALSCGDVSFRSAQEVAEAVIADETVERFTLESFQPDERDFPTW